MGAVRLVFSLIIWGLYIAPPCRCGTLMLATENGIKILDPVTSVLTTVHERPASSVDFRFTKKDLFFISHKQIFYSYYSEFSGSHSEPIPIITDAKGLADLAVDWRRFKLYYSHHDSSGFGTSVVFEAALLGTTVSPFTVVEGLEVTDLALDVYDRRYFYARDGTLCMSSLDVKEPPSQHFKFSFTSNPKKLSYVSKFAVDHHSRAVYVIGYDVEDLQWRLLSTDYNNNHSTLVFNGAELARPLAMGVFDGEVMWANQIHGVYTIYTCPLSPACDIDHLRIVYQTDEIINDVKFYNAQVQSPDPATACEELACSHNCSVVTPYVVECVCPPGLQLGHHDNICVEESAGPGLATMFLREAGQLVTSLADQLMTWMTSQTPIIVLLIYTLCGLMLALLSCGFCVLVCARRPKGSVKLEAYDLRERRRDAGRESVDR